MLSRKEFLRTTAKMAVGLTAGIGAMTLFPKRAAGALGTIPDLPWPYVELDVEEARRRGHQGFYDADRACSYGAFHAIVSMLQEEVGEPYTLMPTGFLEWGRGGGWGWGALCGALTGALTAMNVCRPKSAASRLGDELLGWYTQTAFPTDISNQYAVEGRFADTRNREAQVQSVCGSPLCHISVDTWVAAANVGATSPERRERCGRLTGDVAAYAVQIMNDDLREAFAPLYAAPASVAYCMNCHGKDGMDDSLGKMECTQCHGDHTGRLTAKMPDSFAPAQQVRGHAPIPFTPRTTIRFTIPSAAVVWLAVYDVHGQLVKNLVNLEHYAQGPHDVSWDGTDNRNQHVASGTYFYRLQAGNHTETQRLVIY
jgi:hypothetical protein